MRFPVFTAAFFLFNGAFAQKNYSLKPAAGEIRIDGILNEKAWELADDGGDFIQHYPYDTSASETKTFFKLTFDERNLYAAFICVDRNPEKDFVVQSLKRDFSINTSDAVILTLCPFLDGQNGFSFGVTPQNAQREGAIENGGNFGVSTAWDQVWFSETRITRDTWYAEFRIPLRSIRFPEGNAQWRMNVSRADYKNNETSTWVMVPRNFNISALSFVAGLQWPEASPPRKSGRNTVLIPYASLVSAGDSTGFLDGSKTKPRMGLDAKIALSSGMNLDLTINPDFAQVDVDVQQINLTRFNLFFPERRQFFIENSDLFANFGFTQIRPFFSRRVGLGPNGLIPIQAGARVTGKIGNNWRVGAMVIETKRIDSSKLGDKILPARNYFVGAFQRKIFKASNIGFILVNEMNGIAEKPGNRSTVSGLEYNLLSPDNHWVGKAFYQRSFSPEKLNYAAAHASFLMYRDIWWKFAWNHEYVGKGFRAPTGFVPRLDNYDAKTRSVHKMTFWRLEPNISRTFYPKNSALNNYNVYIYNSSYLDSMFSPTEINTATGMEFHWQNAASFRFGLNRNYVNLYLPFSPIQTDSIFLLGAYSWNNITMNFESSNRKKFNFGGALNLGSFYNGHRYSGVIFAQFRRQPWGVFNLNYQREYVELPYGKQNFELLGLRSEISFSTLMYFTAYLQYNTQAKNVNVNLRYQWRYRPMSDFFVVYSENYNEQFATKDRSVSLKFVYWLNL